MELTEEITFPITRMLYHIPDHIPDEQVTRFRRGYMYKKYMESGEQENAKASKKFGGSNKKF